MSVIARTISEEWHNQGNLGWFYDWPWLGEGFLRFCSALHLPLASHEKTGERHPDTFSPGCRWSTSKALLFYLKPSNMQAQGQAQVRTHSRSTGRLLSQERHSSVYPSGPGQLQACSFTECSLTCPSWVLGTNPGLENTRKSANGERQEKQRSNQVAGARIMARGNQTRKKKAEELK